MFTGIVQALGEIARIERNGDGARLTVATELATAIAPGDSIAVSGVCVSARPAGPRAFEADVMNETLARTSLSGAERGTAVNLELPLRPSDRMGGHIVQGHVDGVGMVSSVVEDGFARVLEIEPPSELLRYTVEKGSIAIDGVSLTVAGIKQRSFKVSLIPETLERTTLGSAKGGTRVNLEVDLLAKYLERLTAR
jgi:riboflavin synthase